MNIGLVSGSTRPLGSTWLVLEALKRSWSLKHGDALTFVVAPDLAAFPIFTPERLEDGAPDLVLAWATFVKTADLLVVATPEYAHNLPALLKNAFEWLVASGEFSRKRVIALTVSPAAPRGAYAHQSMLWTLGALDAEILVETPIYVSTQEALSPKPGALWLDLIDASADLLPF